MDIFSVFTLCGGLAFFLYGMTVMSKSLEKMAGGKLERMLKRMTSSPFKSLLLGAGITIAIQSSSAMTVMLVGLVNSGVMELRQTIGIIMGSNIGTTLTAWILSLTGIESENVFVNLLKPENFSPLIALAGILLIMGSKRQRRRDVGRIMMGFAILMYGMELMSGAVSPLAEMPQFAGLLTAFENPLLGVLVGAVFTGIIQSSAASVAILQALAMTGSITYGMAAIAMYKNNKSQVVSWLALTWLFGAGFIGMEIYEFHHLIMEGFGPDRSGFLSAFFALVGTHGLHVTSGLIWMAVLMFQVSRRGLTSTNRTRILCLSLFWHFLDVVWICVFSVVYLMGAM